MYYEQITNSNNRTYNKYRKIEKRSKKCVTLKESDIINFKEISNNNLNYSMKQKTCPMLFRIPKPTHK